MTTNKPEAVSVYRTDTGGTDKMVCLSEYEALQAKMIELEEDYVILAEEREHVARNSSAFESRMGDLQVENGKLKDECARLRGIVAAIEVVPECRVPNCYKVAVTPDSLCSYHCEYES